jgi:ubiquitin carboxyl-terminal hydrolase 34
VHRPTDVNPTLIPDPMALVPRIMSLLETGRNSPIGPQTSACAQSLVCNCFAVLVEASLRDRNVWNAVQQHARFDELISSLLLEESRIPIRKEVMERLKIISGPLKPLNMRINLTHENSPIAQNPLRIDMLATIWSSVARVIPKTLEHVSQSEEFLYAALWIFRSVAERSPRDVNFSDYLKQWSAILLDHKTEEVCNLNCRHEKRRR